MSRSASLGVYDRYVLRQMGLATGFVALALTIVIFLTQSLRFLELVMESGASAASFWMLTLLALPRFLEIILPIALMAATVFVYHRMALDSEIVTLRAAGISALRLGRPALVLAVGVGAVLLFVTCWLAPVSVTGMQSMRQIIKAHYSTLMFREGVFNPVGSGLTVYVRKRTSEGELEGVLIHDARSSGGRPVTVLAQRGVLVVSPQGQQVVVYNGSRQEFDPATRALRRLDFERYTVDIPEDAPIGSRWREPDERTLGELLHPDPAQARDRENLRAFRVEAVKRVVSPFLAPLFTVVSLVFLLVGPSGRQGQGWRIPAAVGSVIVLQSLFLSAFNISRHTDLGVALTVLSVFLPLAGFFHLLGPAGEDGTLAARWRAQRGAFAS
jgi:lipopolysaccharide export system permease protein